MRKFLPTILGFGCIAAALSSCQQEPRILEPSGAQDVNFTILAGKPETKTYIESDGSGYRACWHNGDQLGVCVDEVNKDGSAWDGTLVNGAASGQNARFTGTVSMTTGVDHTLIAVYPASALSHTYANGSVELDLPAIQRPTLTSYDPTADVLVAKPYGINTTSSSVVIDDMRFARVMSILKIKPAGASGMKALGEEITSLKISAPVTLAGKAKIVPETCEITGWVNESESVTALYSSEKPVLGTDCIYLQVNPQTLTAGTDLTIEIKTENYYILKTVTLSSDMVFPQSHIASINVSIADTNCTNWESLYQKDKIVPSLLPATTTTYETFSNLAVVTAARYQGYSAKSDKGAIQINNNSSKGYGIVTTTSAGFVKEVEVEWNTGTSSGRTLNVYGSHTPYSSSKDLYSTSTQGTLLGAIVCGTSNKLTISGNYEYVGVISSDNAIYLDSVTFTWHTGEVTPVCADPEIIFYSNTVAISCATDGALIYYTTDGTNPSVSSAQYSSPFVIDHDITVKAIAVKNGFTSSAVVSKDCIFNPEVDPSAAPALGAGWLEMPAATNNASYYCKVRTASMNGVNQRNYSFLYDPSVYASLWVAYPLCKAHIGSGRSGSWGADTDIPSDKQTDVSGGYGVNMPTKNYPNNTLSRGHQIPNGSRSGVSAMQHQTYRAVNSTPQIQNGFNGGIWSSLENAVREWVPSADTLYVITGACYHKQGGSESLRYIVNKNDGKTLPLANYYWKAVLKVKRSGGMVTDAMAIGFWLPHDDLRGESYQNYACSVKQIEEFTGFDLFVNLPGDGSSGIEKSAEANTSLSAFTAFEF